MSSPIRFCRVAAVIAVVGAVCSMPFQKRLQSVAAEPNCGNSGPGAPVSGCYCEVCGSDQCVVVPDTKTTKKWAYSTRLVPFCVKSCPNPFKCRHAASQSCPSCESCVRYKRVLIKREVVTKTAGFKCIPLCEACREARQQQSQPPVRSAGNPRTAEPDSAPGMTHPVLR